MVSFVAVKEGATARRQLEHSAREQREFAEALRHTAALMNGTPVVEQVLACVLGRMGLPGPAARQLSAAKSVGRNRVAASPGAR